MSNVCYDTLVNQKLPLISESHAPYTYLTERHLQVMWHEQKYFEPLKTSTGLPIRVLSPGIWNAAGGPDFCKAHLEIGGHAMRGDVEIHLGDEGWSGHGHHVDPAYDRVILHLSLWKPKEEKPIKNSKDHLIHRAYLEPNLLYPMNKLVQLIDLDLYPYQEFMGSGRCSHELFHSLSDEQIQTFFASAAEWRLTQKKKFLAFRIPDPAQQLSAGIAMALGYKHNSEAFLDLFQELLPFSHLSEGEIHALALGMCGYFEEEYQKRWGDSEGFQTLLSYWIGLAPQALYQAHLRRDRVRPLNHPVRRLAYLAKLLTGKEMNRLFGQLLGLWKAGGESRLLRDQMVEAIPSYPDEYWNHHYTFETKRSEKIWPLIGEDLKYKMLINAFFPLLHHEIKERGAKDELEAFSRFYQLFPAEHNSKSRYMTHRFFGNGERRDFLSKAYLEQGAFQVHRDFCLHFEASCVGCPFVDRFKQRQ